MGVPARKVPAFGRPEDGRMLRFLTWNIHAATATGRYHQYATHAWKQVLPHAERRQVLDGMAAVVSHFDVVGLQEVDAGSLRSGFINQARYLAEGADFPFWHHQLNRRVGKIARASNGLLARHVPSAIAEHRLPGAIPGRGALWARFGNDESALVVVVVHLALGRRAREQQLGEIASRLSEWSNVVVMGDCNAPLDSPEMRAFLRRTGLTAPLERMRTFPSWRPQRSIDHVLVSPAVEILERDVLDCTLSDHRPVATTVRLPARAWAGE